MSVLFDQPGPRARTRHGLYGVAASLVTAGVVAYVVLTLWREDQITPKNWEPFGDPDIVNGLVYAFGQTLLAAVLAIALAMVMGLALAAGRLSDHRLVRWPCVVVIEFFRAVPLVVMILVIFLGFGETTQRYGALVIGLMLYNGSVLAETFRAGVNAVPRGQGEAAYSLGMRKTQVMWSILWPQAIRVMLPAIISQGVVTLKDTALGFVVAAPQAVSVGKQIYSAYDNPIATGIVLAAVFIVINYTLSRVAQLVEGRQRRKGRAVLTEAQTTVAGGLGSGVNN